MKLSSLLDKVRPLVCGPSSDGFAGGQSRRGMLPRHFGRVEVLTIKACATVASSGYSYDLIRVNQFQAAIACSHQGCLALESRSQRAFRPYCDTGRNRPWVEPSDLNDSEWLILEEFSFER